MTISTRTTLNMPAFAVRCNGFGGGLTSKPYAISQVTEWGKLLSLSKMSIYTYSLLLDFHTRITQSFTKLSRIFSLLFLLPYLLILHYYNKTSLFLTHFSLHWHKLQLCHILHYSHLFQK